MTSDLSIKIAAILNKVSRENESDTPDFILAEYLQDCLLAGEKLINRRENWYARSEEKSVKSEEKSKIKL